MSTTSIITFADFEQMRETPGKQELIDGELIEIPPAKYRHMDISKRVFMRLSSGPVGKRAYFEMGYRIGSGWLVPDVSVTRPNQVVTDYLIGSPALAVEILSPDNRASLVARKLNLYLAEGAEEVWVIDPAKRTMSVHRSTQDGQIGRAHV